MCRRDFFRNRTTDQFNNVPQPQIRGVCDLNILADQEDLPFTEETIDILSPYIRQIPKYESH